ncbi:hypothetical protein [Cryobacterium melibiosiphilum]|uniref:hypothetical protein n=1 Tax=Cryobacterium melibiosiphilum TaxID=995039 RepID=UPI0011C2145E|nr:hypothetical protein [Cryobacterium melibiosiphilum]
MADPLVIHADLMLFLTGWFREALAARPESYCQGVVVTHQEPSGDLPERCLVIRVDGGPDTSILTAERDVGLSILAGTKENPQEAIQLALMVHALRSQIPGLEPGNPVAAVLSSNGPFAVVETQPVARQYITLVLGVVGTLL